MKVPIKLKKSNILIGIEVTTSNPTVTYLPTTHQLLGTMRIFLISSRLKTNSELSTELHSTILGITFQ